VALSRIRIVRITVCRVAIEVFRSGLVERRIKAYAFDKIGIGDVIPTEGDKVPGPFVDEVSAMVGVNADVNDGGSGVEIMPPAGLCREDFWSYYFGAVQPLTCAA
jgi:hypothetical protein